MVRLVGAIDQGTSSSRFIVYDCETGDAVERHQVEVDQLYPHEGWLEQDPMELLKSVVDCLETVAKKLENIGIPSTAIQAIGITNQRETTIVWNRKTGVPLTNAIVWADARNGSLVKALSDKHGQDCLRKKCGLPLATYFSATKLAWLMENNQEVKDEMGKENLLFGTVDTWLLWNLTGGIEGGVHATDVTNASRTMLMNLTTLEWDADLLNFFDIPEHILPTIRPTSANYGKLASGCFKGVTISGIIGDQQGALLGHGCTSEGQVKSTYGTGCFMLYNTGENLMESNHGLLTTVAYQREGQPPSYALEGSVSVAGLAVRWLKDNLGLISSSEEISILAEKVNKTDGVYFVPAFSGLFAPHWRSDARGVICGLSAHTTKHHIARATLESVCFQVKEIFEAMKKDSGSSPVQLLVDGGMTESQILLQLQANLLGEDVSKPNIIEVTALGAAIAAGVMVQGWSKQPGHKIGDQKIFRPQISEEERNRKMKRWHMAVERSLAWEIQSKEDDL